MSHFAMTQFSDQKTILWFHICNKFQQKKLEKRACKIYTVKCHVLS